MTSQVDILPAIRLSCISHVAHCRV